MVFSSAVFLFIFLPIVIMLHTAVKNTKIKNVLLIAASLIFYSWGEPVYVVLLIVSVCMNWGFGRAVAGGAALIRCAGDCGDDAVKDVSGADMGEVLRKGISGRRAGNVLREEVSGVGEECVDGAKNIGSSYAFKRVILTIAVCVNLILVLAVFKYAGFAVRIINVLPFVNIPVPNIHMPIGISFYTFQALSYVIDSYRDEEGRYGSLFDVFLYISLFPQLVAGPIVKYNSVRKQLNERYVTAEKISGGISLFIIGLSKKMLIANVMATAADKVYALGIGELDTFSAWVGALGYLMQIYFDFSGYSDMAVGIGQMLGFDFPKNFNYPYIAVSVRDFWKRWHISLTSWFRDYLYIPLGGNRKGKARTLWNRFFVFLCTGIWHGADFTFLVWGIYHGLLTVIESIVEPYFAGKKSRGLKLVGHIYTLLAVTVGFVIFRADGMGQAIGFIGAMFSFGRTSAIGTMTAMSVMTPLFVATLIAAVITSTPFLSNLLLLGGTPSESGTMSAGSTPSESDAPLTEKNAASPFSCYAKMLCTIVLYVLCIMEIAAGSYNPFIYFRF